MLVLHLFYPVITISELEYMNRTSIFVASSVFVASAFTLFCFSRLFQRPHVKKVSFKPSVPRFTLGDTSLPKVIEFDKGNLTLDFCTSICTLINISDYDTRQKLIISLHQASSFRRNFDVIRDSKCLELLLSLLDSTSGTLSGRQQNLNILHVVMNLACDQQNFPIIKDYLDDILLIANAVEYSDQACVALQVFGNIALTPDGCKLLRNKCGYLCNMLKMRDPYVLRNLLVVFVNLSCDIDCCGEILTQDHEEFMKTLEYSLSSSAPISVSLKMIVLLNNLYSRMIQKQETSRKSSDSSPSSKSIANSLKNNCTLVKSWIMFLISSSKDLGELEFHLQKLASSLEKVENFNVEL
ncbi:unnamed protein product [Schistosoma intercalatum]|nr:unnamed protein product [Schistosoma intercalatum]